MKVRKYLFWFCRDGIRTYKVSGKGSFELVKPLGNDYFRGHDLTSFSEWFQKYASITADEYIDFCFLSDQKIESRLLKYSTREKSSWDKTEISTFCAKHIPASIYEFIYDEGKSFVCQNGNVYDSGNVRKMYVKCVPEFSVETKERVDEGSPETSMLNRYYMDRLKELRGY